MAALLPPPDKKKQEQRRIRWRAASAAALTAAVLLLGISGLMKPLPNACIMTYMYPTYIPIPAAPGTASGKYGLYLYHEGWKKIDFQQHLRALAGVPVLFIPGNGGSYKQVRSLAAESDRAYNAGPQEDTYYRESSLTPGEAGMKPDGWWGQENWDSEAHVRDLLADSAEFQGEYVNRLDWFAVDLEGEHSALDGRILEEHTDYVVQAIHRILDQYRIALHARSGNNKANEDALPTSVILVGHSMGGFVARAAVVHPSLRKGAVATVVTISSPHLVAPVALQPSLGHFFSRVNTLWRSGYETSRSRSGRLRLNSETPLSHVVVISIPGGIHDYQVRSRMASLEGLVPETHSLTLAAPGMLNAWLSTEHQTILWCNQLVVQLAHTLLKLVDNKTGQTFSSPRKRLGIFIAKLRSSLPQTFGWLPTAETSLALHAVKDKQESDSNVAQSTSGYSGNQFSCPRTVKWESHERDLHIDTSAVTVLAMDGRRRWLDIKKQEAIGKTNFVLVTNLAPCVGIRIHLWPEDTKSYKDGNVLEITTKMAQLPAGPAPRQIEPGGQSEQAPPSGILRLSRQDLEGFRYITISVAPRPTIAGGPPPAASMAVGQFFNSMDGSTQLSPWALLSSAYKRQALQLKEEHPLVMNFSISVGLGVLPLFLEVKTASCGMSDSTLAKQQAGDSEVSSLCKLRCFPPLALFWDSDSGLYVIPGLRAEFIMTDSAAVLAGLKYGSQETSMILLVDPHCGYNITFEPAKSIAVNRFLLTQASQIGGFMVAILLFALMRQRRAWELNKPLPSVCACLERNLMFPTPFVPLCFGPLFLYFSFAAFGGDVPLPYVLSSVVAVLCYVFANGIVALLAIGSMVTFHAAASLQLLLQSRWRSSKIHSVQRLIPHVSACLNMQMVKKMRAMPKLTMGMLATVLVFFVHPALGLAVLLVYRTWSCHIALCSYHRQNVLKSNEDGWRNRDDEDNKSLTNLKTSALESFKYFQGLLLLYLLTIAMLLPSFIAWIQKPKVERTLPWLLDSVLSFGIILHGFYAGNGLPVRRSGLSLAYGTAGLFAYWAGLVLAPYRAFYALAALGLLNCVMRFLFIKSNKGDSSYSRHSHRH